MVVFVLSGLWTAVIGALAQNIQFGSRVDYTERNAKSPRKWHRECEGFIKKWFMKIGSKMAKILRNPCSVSKIENNFKIANRNVKCTFNFSHTNQTNRCSESKFVLFVISLWASNMYPLEVAKSYKRHCHWESAYLDSTKRHLLNSENSRLVQVKFRFSA